MSQRYVTVFNLEGSVNDREAALDYLSEEDMTEYVPRDIRPFLISVSWELIHNDSGVIVVDAKEELSEENLERLSSWISGQNSDGLGEGFEQQDFATDYEEYTLADGTVEKEYFMCSFDWRDNDYKLVKIEEAKPWVREDVRNWMGDLKDE